MESLLYFPQHYPQFVLQEFFRLRDSELIPLACINFASLFYIFYRLNSKRQVIFLSLSN